MNNAQHPDWSSLPPYALWLLGVAILGPFLAFYFGGLRERKNRKRLAVDEFRAAIASQRADLDVNRWTEAEFYRKSVPLVTQATYALRPFIGDSTWLKLNQLLSEFQHHHESEFEGGYTRLVAEFNKELGDNSLSHFELLGDYLNRFDELAKDA